MKRILILVTIQLLNSINAQPDTIWTKTFGGQSYDLGHDLQLCSDGGFIIGGSTNSFGDMNQKDIWIIRTDSSGDTLWTKRLGGNEEEDTESILVTNDNNYLIVGRTRSFGNGLEAWIIKMDDNGDTLWSKLYGGSQNDVLKSVVNNSENELVLTGYTTINNNTEMWILKIDSAGNTIWDKHYGSTATEIGNDIFLNNDSTMIIVGYIFTDNADLLIMEIDTDGDTLWTKTYGGNDTDEGYDIIHSNYDNLMIGGMTYSWGDVSADALILEVDILGNMLWANTYGGFNADFCNSIVRTDSSEYVFTGITGSYGAGDYDIWLVKTGTAIIETEKTNHFIQSYAIFQNYPNPFNPITTIQYELPQRSDVQFTIYDLLGKKVTTLVSETQGAGYKSAQWNATNDNGQQVSAGVYFYQIRAGDFVQIKKMILLK